MKYTIIFILSALAISSCSKKKEEEKINRDLLTTDSWQLSALTINPPQIVNGAVITDWYAQLPDCEKDNILFFYTNDTYKADEGATKCSPGDLQNISGTWALVNNETYLQLVHQQDTVNYRLLSLEDDELQMSYTARDTANILHTFTATFSNL